MQFEDFRFERVSGLKRRQASVLAILLLVVVSLFALLSSGPDPAPKREQAVSGLAAREFREAGGEEQEQKGEPEGAEWFMAQRTYGLGFIPQDAEIRALEDMRTRMSPALQGQQSLQKSATASLHWKSHGPGNIGGRVRGLVVDPTNPNILYTGSVAGGVWKSTNAGVSWFPTMNDLITLNVSALAMKPGDPNTLYAGTGEGFFYIDNLPGRGILKTSDGGKTWKRVHIAEGLNSPFITAIAVSPADPNVVYASGRQAVPQLHNQYPPLPVETLPDRGVSAIFKSTDSGETWRAVTSGQIEHYPASVLDNLPADVVVSPTDANLVYAAFGLFYPGGIWKSTNGGQTWSRLTNGLPNPNLPNLTYGRIKLAMAPSDPSVLYASFTYRRKQGDTTSLLDGAMLGLWKTTDGGQSWTQMATPLSSNQRNRNDGHTTVLGNMGNYANAIIIHPADPNIVFVGGLDIYRSTDGGNTWVQISMWRAPGTPENPENLPFVHGDHHVFAFDPSTNPPTLYNGSDGGVARSHDLGDTWGILNKDLGVTQFYTFAVHPSNPNIMLGGTQDNGTPMLLSSQYNLWRDITAGDGWQTFFDYADPTTIYVAWQQLNIVRYVFDYASGRITESKSIGYNGGANGITQHDLQHTDFFTPYELSPNHPNVLVVGTNRLLKSVDRGDSWTPISAEFNLPFATLAIGEGNDDVIWAATYDAKVFKTENSGASWTQVTSQILPTRFITDIEIDPSNINTVYLTYSGYNAAHVLKSTDAGASWMNITNNLPDIPANSIQVQPHQPDLVFLGTDIGVFLSNDGGQTWQPCTNGLPTVSVTAIVLDPNTNRVYAATHGRGAYSAELTAGENAELNVEVAEISLQLQPDHARSTTFTISNSGNANLNYSITATESGVAAGLASGQHNTVSISNSVSPLRHKLPMLNLKTSRFAKGVTPVLRTEAGRAKTAQHVADIVSDGTVLLLDDGDNNADAFIGFGSGSGHNFYWANVFSSPGYDFRLESFDFFMRTEFAYVDTFYFAIGDTNGQMLIEGNLKLSAAPPRGGWYTIPITPPLTLGADSSFAIVMGASNVIGFPAGADKDASVPNNSYYFDPAQNNFVSLSTVAGFENGAFILRANGSKTGAVSRLSVSPDYGTIPSGGSQTITVTFDAQGLAEGNYFGELNLTSNGGERTLPVRILVSNTVGTDDNIAELPRAFRLEQSYPNPFWNEATFRSAGNPETSIRFELPSEGNIMLAIFDLRGRRVALLESGRKSAGQHLVRWNGRDQAGNRVPSGVYFYRLEATSPTGIATVLTKKMTVIK